MSAGTQKINNTVVLASCAAASASEATTPPRKLPSGELTHQNPSTVPALVGAKCTLSTFRHSSEHSACEEPDRMLNTYTQNRAKDGNVVVVVVVDDVAGDDEVIVVVEIDSRRCARKI